MATYDLSQDLGVSDGELQRAPAWVLYVARYEVPVTYSRQDRQSSVGGFSVGAEREPLIIVSDCRQVTAVSRKDSHVSNLVAQLAPGGHDYLAEVLPGDWLLAWLLDDESLVPDLLDRLRRRRPCNGWRDGLKFVGRVKSVQRHAVVDTGSGRRSLRFNLQGQGFSEFDASSFYDQNLALTASNSSLFTSLGRLGLAIDNLMKNGYVDTNYVIPTLLQLLLGTGISAAATAPGNLKLLARGGDSGQEETLKVRAGLTEDADAPWAYMVPESVGDLLGRQGHRSKNSGILAYADLLLASIGIQHYDADQTADPQAQEPGRWCQYSSLTDVMGKFTISVPNFNGSTVWTVLSTYLNQAVNEMYVTLRARPDGAVLPTLVVRQLPFSTKLSPMPAEQRTDFLDLPRWKIPTSAVIEEELGRDNALRKNFVLMTGVAQAETLSGNLSQQMIDHPPIRDEEDIRRNGLHPDIGAAACGLRDVRTRGRDEGPGEWANLRADILMGQHLALTGTLVCAGIQAPICIGDNLEYDGVCFHIESVQHTGFVDDVGRRRFSTSLQLTHGVAARPDADRGDAGLWVALRPDELQAGQPGFTREVQAEANEVQGDQFTDFEARLQKAQQET